MRTLLISLSLLFTLNACQDKAKEAKAQAVHDAKIATQAKAELLKELKEKEEKVQENSNKLSPLGVNLEEDKITIDTKKTKDFISSLRKKMQSQMEQISNDLEKGIIQRKDAGIEINNEHINIDLNKTKNLLESWAKKIQGFVKEFDDVAQKIDNNTKQGQ